MRQIRTFRLMESFPLTLEHTALKPTLTGADIDQLVAEAKDHGIGGVCVPPFWVKRAQRERGAAPVQLVTVIGFPLGYQMTETKEREMELALRDGADELDLVMNISAFKAGMPWVKIEFARCAKLAHAHEKLIKVIIETAYLDEEEIKRACTWCQDAGVDFVKTSTGFAGSGAKVEHIRLMRSHLHESVGIKASGGIRTYADAKAMLDAGADRLGTSSGVALVQAWKAANGK